MKAITSFRRNRLRTSFLLIVISFCFVSLNAQLAGPYTLGPPAETPDFTSFAEVADTLKKSGISASVTINVLPGSYTDVHITIDTILGSAADKLVVFQSSTGDSTDVTLSYNYPYGDATNYMIRLRGASYITFKQMSFTSTAGDASYGRIFLLLNGTSRFIFSQPLLN